MNAKQQNQKRRHQRPAADSRHADQQSDGKSRERVKGINHALTLADPEHFGPCQKADVTPSHAPTAHGEHASEASSNQTAPICSNKFTHRHRIGQVSPLLTPRATRLSHVKASKPKRSPPDND